MNIPDWVEVRGEPSTPRHSIRESSVGFHKVMSIEADPADMRGIFDTLSVLEYRVFRAYQATQEELE